MELSEVIWLFFGGGIGFAIGINAWLIRSWLTHPGESDLQLAFLYEKAITEIPTADKRVVDLLRKRDALNRKMYPKWPRRLGIALMAAAGLLTLGVLARLANGQTFDQVHMAVIFAVQILAVVSGAALYSGFVRARSERIVKRRALEAQLSKLKPPAPAAGQQFGQTVIHVGETKKDDKPSDTKFGEEPPKRPG